MKNMRICASIKLTDATRAIDVCRKYPFVEIRLDEANLTDGELKEIFSVPDCRKIATCRCNGKNFSDEKKAEILLKSADYGADTIDLEYDFKLADLLADKIMSKGKKIIVSAHLYDELPLKNFLQAVAAKASDIGAEYLKIATYCANSAMIIRFLELYLAGFGNFPREKTLFVPMGSGTELIRLAALELGMPFVYVACDGCESTAEGQIPYSLAKQLTETK